MNNYDAILTDWEKRQKKKQEANWQELKPILQQLKDKGIEMLNINYNGSGDSGAIENIELSPTQITGLSPQEQEIIEEFAFAYLPSGWEINNGSEGNIQIDLTTGETIINHYWLEPTFDESLSIPNLEFLISEEKEEENV